MSVTAYISSYYAIAIAAFMSTANWVLVGIWSSSLDKFYLESWQVFLTCVVIFSFFSNICSAVSQIATRSLAPYSRARADPDLTPSSSRRCSCTD